MVGGNDSLAAQIADNSFQDLLSKSSSAAKLPQELQQAVEAAKAQVESGSTAGESDQQLPDDLQQLLAALSDPQTGVQRQRRSANSAPSFSGKDLLDSILRNNSNSSTTDRSSAAATAQQLLQANAITLVSQKQPAAADIVIHDDTAHYYALRSEAVGAVPWGQALNTHYWWGPKPARPAEVVAEDLRGRILQLYDKHLSKDGKSVSYKGLKADQEFWDYVDATAELQRVSSFDLGIDRSRPWWMETQLGLSMYLWKTLTN